MTIGWALLGPGRHAERNVVPQMKKAAGVRMVAVLSRDRSRGAAFARQHGFAKVYTSLREVLDDPEIDALYDATPDGLHADNAIAAAEAGKHSLVEKPLAISSRECARAIEACQRHGVKLGVVYQQRHEEAHQAARRMVAAGEIGEVLLARAFVNLGSPTLATGAAATSWRVDPKLRSGGTLMSLGDHAFDTLAYLIGQEIEEISAFTDATKSDPPNERVASMLLKFSKGAIGHAASSAKTPFGRRPIEIHGNKGSLIIENSYAYLTGAGEDPRPSVELIKETGGTVQHFPATECFRLEIEQFGRAIKGECEPMTTAEEGLHAMAITEMFYELIENRRVADVTNLKL